jgi:uncharacterized membrane protein
LGIGLIMAALAAAMGLTDVLVYRHGVGVADQVR